MRSNEIDKLSLDDLGEIKYRNSTSSQKVKMVTVKNFAKTIGIMTLATFLSFLFRYIEFHESNIIVAYILGVLLAAKSTEGYFYGIVASVIGVLTFNFFFTEPYYTFITYRPDYPITFVIMLIAAIITSTLTAKVKEEARISFLREKRAQILYRFSKSLLKVRNIKDISEVGGSNIAKLFNRSAIISTINSSGVLGEPHIYPFNDDERISIFKSFNEMNTVSETFKSGNETGIGTERFSGSPAYYIPIKGQSGILGVVGVSCFNHNILLDEQKELLEAVTTQIALAMEREILWEKQEKSKIEMERERLRGDLLRSISHDLRTPLTGILGSTATILDNEDILDKKVKTELLQGVYEDASWLMNSVENILSITRIDEGRVELKKSMEAVEEIVAEAVLRIKKIATNHLIKINIPDDLIMLSMDGILIEQVLVNLLDNAIKYTPYKSTIEIKIYKNDDKVFFEVSDNGKGIPEENIPLIFNRFYTLEAMNNSGRRGTGLGLAICKSIVIAHGGEISAFNNPYGGVTFRFELPEKE